MLLNTMTVWTVDMHPTRLALLLVLYMCQEVVTNTQVVDYEILFTILIWSDFNGVWTQ